MSVLAKLGGKLQQWLDGEDPEGWLSQGPTAIELTRNLTRYSLSSQLPYMAYDPVTKLYHNTGTLGFMLECAPLVGCSLLIQQTLAALFTNSIPEGAIVQILLYGSPKIGATLEEYCVARSNGHELHKISARNLALHLNDGALKILFPTTPFLIRDFKVYISVIFDNNCQKTATKLLEQTKIQMTTSLINANISCKEVLPIELIRLIRELVSSDQPTTLAEELDYDPSLALARQMVPLANHLLVKPHSLQLGQSTIIKMLAAEKFPDFATQQDMAATIGDVLNRTGQIACPFLFACNMYVPNQTSEHSAAQIQTFRWGRLANSVLGSWVEVAKDTHQDWLESKHKVNDKGEKWVKCQFLVALYANEFTLDQEFRVQNNFNHLGWKLRSVGPLSFPAWLNCLPMNHHPVIMQDAATFGLTKTILSSNVASLAPLQGEWKGTSKPILLLVGKNGQLMPWSPFFNENGGNFNISITGKPGSGKSFVMQMIELSVHSLGGQVWVIDDGRSHKKTCELAGGQIIDFNQQDLCFNPFTNIKVLDNNQMLLLLPLITNMALQQRAATDLETAFLEEAIKKSWDQNGNDNSISNISKLLLNHKEQIARDLGQMLFPYTKNGKYGKYVEGKANIDFNNPFTLLELFQLKSLPGLQTIIMLMFINQVTMALKGDRSIPKLLAIDEGWQHLFTPHAAKFLEEAARTFRKFGGSVMIGTQGIDDYYAHPTGITILNNSDWVLILEQPGVVQALEKGGRIKMTPQKQKMLESLHTSTGEYSEIYIEGPFGFTVGRFMVDQFTKILYSSKPNEYQAVETLRQQGYSLIEAVSKVAGVSL